MNVSLVLCTFGDRKMQLIRLLETLKRQQLKSFEIVLVDQNPPGYLDELLQTKREELAFKHVRSDRGLSIARNVGLLSATGEIIGFPDDDCWYYPDTLQQVTAFFQHNPKIDILLGRTVDECGMPSLSPLRKESGAVNRDNIWISGNSNTLFVRRSAVPVPGAFDEQIGVGAKSRYQSGEETDFILKLMKERARAVYLSDLKIGHDQVDDVDVTRTLKRAWGYSLGFGYVLKKHKFGSSYLAYRVVRSILSAILAFVRLRLVYGLSRIVWGAGTLFGYLAAKP